jgi:hypothetical protein
MVGVIIMVIMVCVGTASYEFGMISVASGFHSCELVENFDKTTQWECNKAGLAK